MKMGENRGWTRMDADVSGTGALPRSVAPIFEPERVAQRGGLGLRELRGRIVSRVDLRGFVFFQG